MSVGDEARHGIPGVLVQDGGQAVTEGRLARGVEREDVGDDVLHGDGGRSGHAVGYGHEAVLRVARRVRGVEVGVEDGDREAASVEDAGQPEHGVDMALVRQREQQHVSPATSTVAGAHGRAALLQGHGWRWPAGVVVTSRDHGFC